MPKSLSLHVIAASRRMFRAETYWVNGMGEVVVDRGIISTARRVRQHACVIAAQRPGSTLEHPNSRRGAPFVDSQCNQVHTQYLR
jgi:hypothetical protein